VNDACREYAEKDDALDFPEGLDGYVRFMRTFIANAADLDAKLSELDKSGAPEGFDRYITDNRRQTDVLRAALPDVETAVRANDVDRADAVIDDAIDDFNRIADALEPYALRHGLTDCTSEPEDAQDA
jgi:class 3 adenylate cyclase